MDNEHARSRSSSMWIWIAVAVVGLAVTCGLAVVGVAMLTVARTVETRRDVAIQELERGTAERERRRAMEEQAMHEAERLAQQERAAREEAMRTAEAERAALAQRAAEEGDPLAEPGDPPSDGYGISRATEGDPSARPRVEAGSADVRGSLSREIVRRVVRRHINEIRFCYEQALHRDATRAGTVVVSFVIASSGSVQSATVASSTLGAADAETCIARAVQRWAFPAPSGGGVVLVTLPFELAATG
jgi:TonB family protein